MSDEWVVRIEAYPYSSGNGSDFDQARAGDREQLFTVKAPDIHAALAMAKLFQQGMLTSPFVWQAPIMAVYRKTAGDKSCYQPTSPDPTSVPEVRRKGFAS